MVNLKVISTGHVGMYDGDGDYDDTVERDLAGRPIYTQQPWFP